MPSSTFQALDPQEAGWVPQTDAERERVRAQLGRILASPLFRNSRRFPSFLQYTVEHALAVDAGPLKERTIGIEVFGREPTYDTAQDPVVRMTAAEVRKRLAQYYQAPENHDQLRVVLEPGSYVPGFGHATDPHPIAAAPQPLRRRRWRVPVITALALGGVLALLAGWKVTARSSRAIDQFWSPFVRSASPVLLCIGDPTWSGARDSREITSGNAAAEELLSRNYVRFTDSATLALIAGELGSRQHAFRIRRPKSTEFIDLRDGPSVFIGGFNNAWTLRLSEGLRFTLARENDDSYVRDRQQPASRAWKVSGPPDDVTETYGIATRMLDAQTGQTVLMTSGLLLGTRAAAECLVDESCMDEVQREAQGDLTNKNVQIVVATKVIDEDSGPPRIIAVDVW